MSNTNNNHPKSTLTQYVFGFILSMILTLSSYLLVTTQLLTTSLLLIIILFSAIIQLVVQLIFFFHLNQEEEPHWNLTMILSTAGAILIIVVGSIWIMHHLDYHMNPAQMERELIEKEGMYK
jgi:cytochrome o ubiquinol oxidase operon protein cyoD